MENYRWSWAQPVPSEEGLWGRGDQIKLHKVSLPGEGGKKNPSKGPVLATKGWRESAPGGEANLSLRPVANTFDILHLCFAFISESLMGGREEVKVFSCRLLNICALDGGGENALGFLKPHTGWV